MALRATKPDPNKRRLKGYIFGKPGVGKSTACCQVPNAYYLDCEHGTDQPAYVEALNAAGSIVYHCPDIHEAIKEVSALRSEQHDRQWLVIDPITVLYQDEADRAEKRVGTDYQKHKQEGQKPLRRLWSLINQLDMNVLVTAHAKAEWEDGKSTGSNIADCWDKLSYRFDLELEIKADRKDANKRTARVSKTRMKEFPLYTTFPWSYLELVRRYPLAGANTPAEPITAAKPEDVERLKGLIAKFAVKPETVDKWLAKAEVETLEDMPADKLTKCIEHLLAV